MALGAEVQRGGCVKQGTGHAYRERPSTKRIACAVCLQLCAVSDGECISFGGGMCGENLKTDQKGRPGKGKSVQHLDAVQPCLCTTVALGLAFRIWWGLFSTIFIGKAIGTLAVPRKLHNSTGRTILHARIPTGIVMIGVIRSRYSPSKRINNALCKDGIIIEV